MLEEIPTRLLIGHKSNRLIVTRVAGGSSLITVEITAVPTIDASATATVT